MLKKKKKIRYLKMEKRYFQNKCWFETLLIYVCKDIANKSVMIVHFYMGWVERGTVSQESIVDI